MRTGVIVGLVLAVILGGCASSHEKKVSVDQPVAVDAPAKPSEVPPAAEAVEAPKAEPVTDIEKATPAEVQAAPAASAQDSAVRDDVPDLPSYPGASRTKLDTTTVSSDGWSRKFKLELEARDTFDKVKKFYEEVIQERGWTVGGVSEEAGKAGWKLTREASVAEIRISKEGRKRVTIRLERKDR
ncbi:MAG TPA: hypothetical protein PKL08_03175 [Thermoanaerobaculaceae bacterium]|nr:hypothetical protein [Thermoanaerobaculaceae bacterium]